eukprot:529613-Pyramimonas_sp.AAC.1
MIIQGATGSRLGVTSGGDVIIGAGRFGCACGGGGVAGCASVNWVWLRGGAMDGLGVGGSGGGGGGGWVCPDVTEVTAASNPRSLHVRNGHDRRVYGEH